ncbi:MAG: hypothetical protein JNL82_30655 [Myxococcales bacterium]|nr:hypothetical protein [Myxococcales bacterium]
MATPAARLARLWPVALFAATAGLMVHDHLSDPHDPTLTGTDRYGHNAEGALLHMLAWSFGELLAVYVVLAPGSDRVARALFALALFLPWSFFSLLMVMHQGGIVALHALWMLTLCGGIMVTLIARILVRRRHG